MPDEQSQQSWAKPLLTVEEQIAHLKAKGVTFDLCIEAEAAEYLAGKCQFFHLAAYRKTFAKHVGGEKDGLYTNLDFGHLRLIAELDQSLRDALLVMALDVEHFAKAQLLDQLSQREGEDGYAIVADYRESMKAQGMKYVERELSQRRNDLYCGPVIVKYGGGMPVWAFLEVMSFGVLVSFMGFCAKRWDDEALLWLHYQLKYVKSVRNAAGHSACILNDLGDSSRGHVRIASTIAREIARIGIPKKRRARKLRNARMQQIATLLYLYASIVPQGSSRKRASSVLVRFFDTAAESAAVLPKSNPVLSAADFMQRLTVGFGLLN